MSNVRICSISGCVSLHFAKGYCQKHYARWRKYGDASVRVREKNSGPCSVAGCGRPSRKRSWCASHYAQWRRTGEEPRPFNFTWSDPQPCLVCGAPPHRYRQFCSSNCRDRWIRYGGNPPNSVACISCGVLLDLHERGSGGQRRKSTTKFCRRCKQDYGKYKLTAHQLAERDGQICGICGDAVDMTLRRKDSIMCASVDHITPRALGGTHDPENLQLAHLRCNMVKSDRVGGVAPAVVI